MATDCSRCAFAAEVEPDPIIASFCDGCRDPEQRTEFCVAYAIDGGGWRPYLTTSDPDVAHAGPALIADQGVKSCVLEWDRRQRAYRKVAMAD